MRLTKLLSVPGFIRAMLIVAMLIWIVLGLCLQNKITDVMDNYNEQNATEQVRRMAYKLNEHFSQELSVFEWLNDADDIEKYIRLKNSDSEIVGLLADHGQTLVAGERPPTDEYKACINAAFRGTPSVGYSDDFGLIFANPVFVNDNVRYVIFRCYTHQSGQRMVNGMLSTYGKISIMSRGQAAYLNPAKWTEKDKIYLKKLEENGILKQMRLELSAKDVAIRMDDNGNIIFMSDIHALDGELVGIFSASELDGGLSNIIDYIIWSFMFLGIAFLFGVYYLLLRQLEVIHVEQESMAKSDFLARMSHEIRTPINAIMGMNEMILREADTETVKIYARKIEGASRLLLGIINDILDFSKIEAGKMNIVPAGYKVADMLLDMIDIAEEKANDKGLAFCPHIARDLPSVLFGDDMRIKQILLNIISNAVKYTEKGTVDMSVSMVPRSKIPWGVGKPNMPASDIVLCFKIKDTGIGIREEDQAKLFGEFYRFDQHKNRYVEGTGLGLAIVKRLTDIMHGRVEVESTYGEGSTFTLWLPQRVVAREPIGELRRTAAQENEMDLRKLFAPEARILVVDDNEMNLMVVQTLLRQSQAQVVTASSGLAALRLLKDEQYDLILLDHMMPGLDGIETLQKIKEGNLAPQTPIIVLTANALNGAKEEYMAAGFDDYLSKPVNGEVLEQTLCQYLPQEKQNFATAEELAQMLNTAEAQTAEPQSAGEATATAQPDEQNSIEAQNILQEKTAITAARDTDAGDIILPDTPLLDPELGLQYVGNNEAMYQTILGMFAKLKESKQQKLNEVFAAEDWKNYTILIHALKSNALNAGCKPLADKALALELAGKRWQAEDSTPEEKTSKLEFIRSHHREAMAYYDKLTAEINDYLKQ